MRILIFTTAFAPRIGGIERLTALLAREFAGLGHDVTVATLTPGDEATPRPYRVVRAPSIWQFTAMMKRCDVNLQLNLSLKHLHPVPLRTPLVVSHQNEYTRPTGQHGLRDRLKLALAGRLNGVACSRYIASRVGCRTVIGNPYDHILFRRTSSRRDRPADLVFLGRLVSDKGCDVLIEALALLRERTGEPATTIIGEGPERVRLTELAAARGLRRLRFVGPLDGDDLVGELNRHRILIAPSRYPEPFGIVALEGLACGCLPIVSERGGLRDAIGPHGLTFENGDAADLSEQIRRALADPAPDRRLDGADRHLAGFASPAVAARYLDVLEAAAAS